MVLLEKARYFWKWGCNFLEKDGQPAAEPRFFPRTDEPLLVIGVEKEGSWVAMLSWQMRCLSQSRTAQDPSKIGQAFVSSSVFGILKSYHTFVCLHSSFCKHPTVSLKPWKGEGTYCWMLLSAEWCPWASCEREGDSISQAHRLFGLEGPFGPCSVSQEGTNILGPVALSDKSTGSGGETEAFTADVETLWNIEASFNMELLGPPQFSHWWRVGVGSPLLSR